MQVSVETGDGLQRKMTVQIPAEEVQKEVENRLKSMQGRVKIDGFRPGKVPLSVVKKRYSSQVFQEVASELIESSFRDAISQEDLRPAGQPSIDNSGVTEGQPIEYTATFEVYPEITISPVSGVTLEKQVAEITDTDVDNMLDILRKQRASWSKVERAAETGDRVTIDFKGTIDGVAFDGGSAQNVPIVIGSGSMIPGFEEKLAGLSAGDETSINVTFPDDYKASDLAGKSADFAITVSGVEASELPEVNDELAKTFGVETGGLEKLREDIRANMQRELDKRVRHDLKMKVMDYLLEANPIEVPDAIVVEEANALKQQASMEKPGIELSLESFMDDAANRVKLGMILSELMKQESIQIGPDKIQSRLETMSKDYEDPEEFINHYKSNPQLLSGIEVLVMEDTVVDWVVEHASVSEIKGTFDGIMNPTS